MFFGQFFRPKNLAKNCPKWSQGVNLTILDVFGQQKFLVKKIGPDGPGIDKFETCLTPRDSEKIPEVIFEKMEKRQMLTSNFGLQFLTFNF